MSIQWVPEIVAWVLAVLFALFVGTAELHTDDTGVIAGLVVLGACGLALLRPVHAWRWGVAMVLAIAVPELYLLYVDPRPNLRSLSAVLGVLAFVTAIALAGAYMGVALRKLGSSFVLSRR